jgi:hypothetical protein
VAIVLLSLSEDFWGHGVLMILMFARLLNTGVIRRRSQPGWHGEKEPGRNSDHLILLSQDRWARIKGTVDDLKSVTSGQWLREQTFLESSVSAVATVLDYLDAALASDAHGSGKLILFILLIASAGLLAIANEFTEALFMHGCIVQVKGVREAFPRSLNLVEKLLQEKDRNDEAMRAALRQLGMTVPGSSGDTCKGPNTGQVTI